MKRLGTLIVMLLLYSISGAQVVTTEGTDFWVGFLRNYSGAGGELNLMASGRYATYVRVANASGSWTASYNITPGQVLTIPIPGMFQPGIDSDLEVVRDYGLHVTSGAPISLYASNYISASYDNTNILPTSSLRSNYIIQSASTITHPSNGNEFCVVATENNTLVYIEMPVNSTGSIVAGTTDSVLLQQGQTYLVTSESDISGTRVWTDRWKPVAVFMGSVCVFVPSRCCCCDHIYEEAIPTEYWGRHFGITTSRTRTFDRLKITAQMDNTVVTYCDSSFTLQARQSREIVISPSSDTAFYLEGSKPISVFLYLVGFACGGVHGDPSFTVIHPIEEQVSAITFATYNTTITDSHYVNVVTRSLYTNDIYLDRHLVNSNLFHPLHGNSDYVYAQLNVTHGIHTLSSNYGGFVAHVYGLGRAESYSYSAGASLDPINPIGFLNGLPFSMYDSTNNVFCLEDTLYLSADILHIESTVITWNFGDGSGLLGSSVAYSYYQPGDYTITVHFAYVDECYNITSYDLEVPVRILPQAVSNTDTIVCDSLCFWNGQYYDSEGTYSVYFPTEEMCDSIARLDIHSIYVPPQPSIEFEYDCHGHKCYLYAVGEGNYYRWRSSPYNPEIDGQAGDSVIEVTPDVTRTYYLYMAHDFDSLCGTEISYNLPARGFPKAEIHVNHDWVDYNNFEVILSDKSTNTAGRVWYADGEVIGTSLSVKYSYPFSRDSVTITLDAYDEYGCHDEDTAFIYLLREGVYAPNVITPDLLENNRFQLIGYGLLDGEIWIFDREGRQVWYTDNIFDSWDGTKGGKRLQSGAYAYTIRYRYSSSPNIWQRKTGTVTIVR